MIASVCGGVNARANRKAFAAEQNGLAERRLLEASVARHIVNYFRDLPVPPSVNLLDGRYISMCVDSNVCDAVDAAYMAMRSKGVLQGSCGDGTIGEDVRFVVRLLRDIRLKCVPQEFSAGMFLMHLEILEGLSF